MSLQTHMLGTTSLVVKLAEAENTNVERIWQKTSPHQSPLVRGAPLCAANPFFPPRSPLSSPVLTRTRPPPARCGPAHTWPSQIRALENRRAERKAGCVVEREGGRGGR